MAIFKTETKKTTKKSVASTPVLDDGRLSTVLKAPWFSEKALLAGENGVYVFQVTPEATKTQIKEAIMKFYKVMPKKVRIANLPAKKVSMRTRRGVGTRARRHKAYVYLAKGDSIQLV